MKPLPTLLFCAIAVALTTAFTQRHDDPPPTPPIEDGYPQVPGVPAFTAYIEPDPEGATVSEAKGVTDWDNRNQSICWYGYFPAAGALNPAVRLRLPVGASSTLRLTVTDTAAKSNYQEERDAHVRGSDVGPMDVHFLPVEIPKPGYYRFQLSGEQKTGVTFGDVGSLLLSGPAAQGAHFNLKERRNAASVHLGYPLPEGAKAMAFYNEVTVRTDPVWSYYMACGFRRGYFGIQVNSPTERRIIFSVWDSGTEAVDRNKVSAEDRVQLLAKGDGVVASGFGNEGTGGHSHLVYPWKTGQTQRFLVTAQPDGTHTIYAGYFYFPEKKAWGLIARFRAPKDGDTLRGLYSFNENFGGANGQKRRLAEFGPGWIRTADGQWSELLTARFTHDPTGKEDRKDYGAGVTEGRFFLSNGGFLASDPIQYGDTFTRPPAGKAPADIPATLPDH